MASSSCKENKTLFAGPFPSDYESKIRERLAMTFACFRVRGDDLLKWQVYTWRESRLGGHESIVIGLPQLGFVTIELTFEKFQDPSGNEQTNDKRLSLDSKFIGPGNDDRTNKFRSFGNVDTTSDVIVQKAIDVISSMPAYVYGLATCQDFVDGYLVAICHERPPTQLKVVTGFDHRTHVVDRDFIRKWLTTFIFLLSLGYLTACLLLFRIDHDDWIFKIIPLVARPTAMCFFLADLCMMLRLIVPYGCKSVIGRLLYFNQVMVQKVCVWTLENSYRYLSQSTILLLLGLILVCGVVALVQMGNYLYFIINIYVCIFPLFFIKYPREGAFYVTTCGAVTLMSLYSYTEDPSELTTEIGLEPDRFFLTQLEDLLPVIFNLFIISKVDYQSTPETFQGNQRICYIVDTLESSDWYTFVLMGGEKLQGEFFCLSKQDFVVYRDWAGALTIYAIDPP